MLRIELNIRMLIMDPIQHRHKYDARMMWSMGIMKTMIYSTRLRRFPLDLFDPICISVGVLISFIVKNIVNVE